MNKIDKNPEYKRMYKFVKNKFDKTSHFKHGPFDETFYTMRVYESAKEIMGKLKRKIKREQVLVASILHDVGKTKLKSSNLFSRNGVLDNAHEEWHKHAKLGVPIAKSYLKRLGHSKGFIDEVCYLIENHDKRDNLPIEANMELKVLQDADLIADIGIGGLIRPFLFSGKFQRSVISSIEYLQKEDRTSEGDQLNLDISKKIAKREMKIQRDLAKEIYNEIDSDLI